MKPKKSVKPAQRPDNLRAEYSFDYTKAERGKYYERVLMEGTNIAVLDPDIAKAFPTSAAVNDALRVVLSAGRAAAAVTPRPRTRVKAARTS